MPGTSRGSSDASPVPTLELHRHSGSRQAGLTPDPGRRELARSTASSPPPRRTRSRPRSSWASRQIDTLAYELHGLSDDGIAVAEGA